MASLSIVATPIGNLEDITLRAISTLKDADVILCEDTRVTKKLLDRHGISKLTVSYHARSKLSKTEEIISMLKEGKDIALVSDAGTPGISDPGAELVSRVRKELAEDIESGSLEIISIPGPSALTAALSIAGVPCSDFTFLGFLPHKKGRETLFREIAASKRTVVFYESPHRILKTLESLVKFLDADSASRNNEMIDLRADSGGGGLSRRVTVCRELTKIYEEVISGTAASVKEFYERNPEKVKGEFVVIVSR